MISVRHLSHRYAQAQSAALSGIDLDIAAGECLGLLGANGAGKTTLMSLLCGLFPVQQGEIVLDGVPLQRLSRAARQQISLVPQDFAFYPLLSVWDNMLFFAALYRVKNRPFLRQLLEQCGLDEHRHKQARHLSGGLKRRLNFAIGQINTPRLVFLDEITVGIDPASRRFILESVADLTRRGVTVIYTSHYLQEIETLCDKIALLSHGRMIYHGALHEVLAQSGQTPLTFRTERPLSPEALAQYGIQVAADGEMTAPADMLPETLCAWLQQQNHTVQSLHYGHASLEAFYLNFLQEYA
ncbi:MAG: ABC transporter ATP-binding protein [Neisseria sp.]|nr:ABC transporter ATP-binding protein [Neisseria sp.]